jgi:hypothetical protein
MQVVAKRGFGLFLQCVCASASGNSAMSDHEYGAMTVLKTVDAGVVVRIFNQPAGRLEPLPAFALSCSN